MCAAEYVASSRMGVVRALMQYVLERAEAALRFGRARLLSSLTQVLGADAGSGIFHGGDRRFVGARDLTSPVLPLRHPILWGTTSPLAHFRRPLKTPDASQCSRVAVRRT